MGEGARAALRREITEELGCEVEVGEALAVVRHSYPDLEIALRPFLCRVVAGEPEALEHEAIGWFGPGEIESLGLAGADREVAASLREWG